MIEWLDERRQAEGWTHGRLAEALGMSGANWSRMFHRLIPLTLDVCNRAAELWPDDCEAIRKLAIPCEGDAATDAA